MWKNIGLSNGLFKRKKDNIEHFTGLGGAWSGLLGSADTVIKHIPEGVEKASIKYKKKEFVGLVETCNENIQLLHTIAENKGRNEYYSCAPILKGSNNNLLIYDKYSWENGAEGEFECVFESELDDIRFSFFNPKYIYDLEFFKRDKIKKVSLSAIALSLHELEEQHFAVNSGPTYDVALEEFLKENPDKTEKDFEAPVFHLTKEHFRMFNQTDYALEYEVAGQIENIEKTSLLGNELTILTVNFMHDDSDQKLFINVYVSNETLGDYVPQIGDGIVSIIWLCGYFK